MKKFLIEYVNVIGYVVTGLIFGLACFILFLNFYHSKEVANQYVKADNYVDVYTKNKSKFDQIKSNSAAFDANKYRGSVDQISLMSIKAKLDMCISKYEDTKANEIFAKKTIGIQDVYNLLSYYQSDIINDCVTLQIYNINIDKDSTKLKSLNAVRPFIENNSKILMTDMDYLKRSLQNNSSYNFSSDYDKINIFNLTRDSYTKIELSYENSIDLLLDVSEWFKNEVGGAA